MLHFKPLFVNLPKLMPDFTLHGWLEMKGAADALKYAGAI